MGNNDNEYNDDTDGEDDGVENVGDGLIFSSNFNFVNTIIVSEVYFAFPNLSKQISRFAYPDFYLLLLSSSGHVVKHKIFISLFEILLNESFFLQLYLIALISSDHVVKDLIE